MDCNQIDNDGIKYLAEGLSDAETPVVQNISLIGNLGLCDGTHGTVGQLIAGVCPVLIEGELLKRETLETFYFVLYEDNKLCSYNDVNQRKQDIFRVMGGDLEPIDRVERTNNSSNLSFVFFFGTNKDTARTLELMAQSQEDLNRWLNVIGENARSSNIRSADGSISE